MRIDYYSETDTLYIALHDGTGVDAEELANHLVVDYDVNNRVVGIEVSYAFCRL